jgi:hypothetical protein
MYTSDGETLIVLLQQIFLKYIPIKTIERHGCGWKDNSTIDLTERVWEDVDCIRLTSVV